MGLMRVRLLVILSTLALVFSTCAGAQNSNGRIVGTIYDQTGAIVPGVHIVVTNTATRISRETTSDSSGFYQVLSLPIGSYTVLATQKGFNPVTTTASNLEINQSLKVDIKLQVGANTETVTVESTPATVETINPTMGSTISEREIGNAPLNGRNVLDLALLQPGVLPADNPGNAGATSANTAFSISGGRNDSNTFLLDGGANNDLLDNGVVYNPNPDSIQEFKVLTSNFGAEYGRNGGGIVTVVTKSGTNAIHGSAFEFNRNTAYNANDFFSNQQQQARGDLKRNQYGGTLGGPIKKDKLFFFLSYQGQRQTQLRPSGLVTTFTPQQLQGDFSASPNAKDNVACFLTGLPQPSNPCVDGNMVPLPAHPFFQPDPVKAGQGIFDPNTIDPVAKAYLKAGLIPVSQKGFANFQNPAQDNNDEYTGKFDWEATGKDHFTATLGRIANPQLTPIAASTPLFGSTSNNHRQFFNLAYTHIVSPTMLNEFRVTAQRNDTLQAMPSRNLGTPNSVGINITPDNATAPTQLTFPGLTAGFSIQGPSTLIDNTFSYSDAFSWTHGRHTMKFGGGLAAFQNNQVFDFFVDGNLDFQASNGAGDPLANFLLGLPNSFFQAPAAPSNIRTKATYAFAQDEWHVFSNLVLTYGLRYEFSLPKSDTGNRLFDVIPGVQSTVFPHAPVGLVFPGDKGAPTGANFPAKNNFAPRFGFAWQPFKDAKTSVRGGFGVFYDILKAEDNFQFNGQVPFASSAFISFPTAPSGGPFTFMGDPYGSTGTPNPFPSKPVNHNVDFAHTFGTFGGVGVFFVDPHLRTPYTYQYNLSLEHELSKKLTAEAAYVGSTSHKLTALKDINYFDPKTLASGNPQRILNETPGNLPDDVANGISGSLGFLNEFTNSGDSNYNALQLSLRKQPTQMRFVGTTYFTLGYTWAHSIDDASGFRNNSSKVPAFNERIFRTSSDFDLRHVLVFSGGWDLPFNRGPRKLVKGWSLYPILSYRTGYPFSIFSGLQTSNLRLGPSGLGDAGLTNANLIAPIQYLNPRTTQPFGQNGQFFFFNPASFSDNPTGPYGTAPRNLLRGPGRTNMDLSLAKVTPLRGDRLTAEFRMDAFNVFNHTQFQNLGNDASSPNLFGQVISTYDPRILQLAVHIRF